MGGLLGGDSPLGHRNAAVAGERAPSVAPLLLSRPLDEVVAVSALLGAELDKIPLGMSDASGVHIGNRVSPSAPVAGVRALEFRHIRNGLRRNPHDLPLALPVKGPFSVEGPGNQQGISAGRFRFVDIHVDGDSVPHFDRNVLHADDALLRHVLPRVKRRHVFAAFPLLGTHGIQLLLRTGLHHFIHDDFRGIAVTFDDFRYKLHMLLLSTIMSVNILTFRISAFEEHIFKKCSSFLCRILV